MTRVLSGIQPTGDLHLGNYVGAIRQYVADQHEHDAFYCVVDLHALTMPRAPGELRERTLETAGVMLAAGLDPDVCTLFVQSHVPEHTELSWLLECTASVGELRRMTQFKDKSAKGGEESARVGLFTYPVLQAADILLYDADRVPVGVDQRQHLELTRDLALRFNSRYGTVFTVPEAAIPKVGARIMDLQNPAAKMSKSADSPQGTALLLEPPETLVRKIRRAVTDTETEVRYDPEAKPGVSNLLELLAVATGRTPDEAAKGYTQYGPLKDDTASAVVEFLRPLQERYAELSADPRYVRSALQKGAEKAQAVASRTLARARDAIGLLPRS
ncbi:MAG TPA: tryptophan--tRNA ligase [Acidimicrobiales bacterium]|nr:tryptophan--tRNA ligase [Acidimicrobiales bacterium]